MLPWPSRAERRQHVQEARDSAETARLGADQARGIEQDLERIMAENNFAGLIAEQIIRHRRHT
jgi:hypothetical protein